MSLRDEDIDGDHLSARGMGENNFIAANDDAESRARNRRVEIALSPAWADAEKPGSKGSPID